MGARHLLNDADGLTKFMTELRRSLDAFEAEGLNLTVASAILAGQAQRVDQLRDRLQQDLTLPTTVVAPFEGSALSSPALAEQETVSRVSFTSLMGLALGKSSVDLTPKALKLHRTFEDRATALVGLGCQVMGMLLLICCVIMGQANKDERYHARLLHEHEVSSQQTQQVQALMEQLVRVKQWHRHRTALLDAVVELSSRSPEAIQWDSLTFTQGEQLVLKGQSEQMPKVFDFAEDLKHSPICATVEAKRVTKKSGEQEMTRFEIICSLAVPVG